MPSIYDMIDQLVNPYMSPGEEKNYRREGLEYSPTQYPDANYDALLNAWRQMFAAPAGVEDESMSPRRGMSNVGGTAATSPMGTVASMPNTPTTNFMSPEYLGYDPVNPMGSTPIIPNINPQVFNALSFGGRR